MNKIKNSTKNIEINLNENKNEYFAIFIAAFTLFSIIWPVFFAVHDDILSYTVVKNGDILATTIGNAKMQGRFWFLVSSFFSYFPFIFDNFIIYKFITYSSICFSVFALGILLYRNVNKESAFLSMIIFFTFAQLDNQHNLLVCYAFSHQIAIGILLLSIERLLSFYKTKNRKKLLWSAFLLFSSTVLYESFVLFSTLLLCIALLNNIHNKKVNYKQTIKDLRFHIIIISFYLFVYFIWKYYYPGNYDGAQIQFISIIDSLEVLLKYGLARVPLVSTIHNLKKIHLFMIEPIFVLKGLIVSIAAIFVLKKSKRLNEKYFYLSIPLCILGIFLPVILHSLTSKYVGWVHAGSYAYLPSFYSYFFITILISLFTLFLYQLARETRIIKVIEIIIFIIILVASIITDINNKIEVEKFQIQQKRYIAFNNAVSSEYFDNIENGSIIYIPDYNGIHNYMPNMQYYASIYSDKQHTFTNKIEDLTFESPTYGFHYNEETGDILIGKLKSNLLVDDIYVVSNDPTSIKTLILNQNEDNIINVSGNSSAPYGEVAIIPISFSNNKVEIHGKNIDLFSSYIVERTLKNKSTQHITLSDGFHEQEIWGKDIVYWCRNIGKFVLYNTNENERYVTVTASIASGDNKKPYSLILSGNDIEQKVQITTLQQDFSFGLLLQPGKNEFTFNCDAPPIVTTNGDTRELVFYVMNFNMKFQED